MGGQMTKILFLSNKLAVYDRNDSGRFEPEEVTDSLVEEVARVGDPTIVRNVFSYATGGADAVLAAKLQEKRIVVPDYRNFFAEGEFILSHEIWEAVQAVVAPVAQIGHEYNGLAVSNGSLNDAQRRAMEIYLVGQGVLPEEASKIVDQMKNVKTVLSANRFQAMQIDREDTLREVLTHERNHHIWNALPESEQLQLASVFQRILVSEDSDYSVEPRQVWDALLRGGRKMHGDSGVASWDIGHLIVHAVGTEGKWFDAFKDPVDEALEQKNEGTTAISYRKLRETTVVADFDYTMDWGAHYLQVSVTEEGKDERFAQFAGKGCVDVSGHSDQNINRENQEFVAFAGRLLAHPLVDCRVKRAIARYFVYAEQGPYWLAVIRLRNGNRGETKEILEEAWREVIARYGEKAAGDLETNVRRTIDQSHQ